MLNAARKDRPAAAGLPVASEACFSIEEHLGIVGGRANRLGDISPESDIDRDALAVRAIASLLPVWDGGPGDDARDGAREDRH